MSAGPVSKYVFNEIPGEIFSGIISHVNPPEFCRLAQVCIRFMNLIANEWDKPCHNTIVNRSWVAKQTLKFSMDQIDLQAFLKGIDQEMSVDTFWEMMQVQIDAMALTYTLTEAIALSKLYHSPLGRSMMKKLEGFTASMMQPLLNTEELDADQEVVADSYNRELSLEEKSEFSDYLKKGGKIYSDTIENRYLAAEFYANLCAEQNLFGKSISFEEGTEKDEFKSIMQNMLDAMSKSWTFDEIEMLVKFVLTPIGRSILQKTETLQQNMKTGLRNSKGMEDEIEANPDDIFAEEFGLDEQLRIQEIDMEEAKIRVARAQEQVARADEQMRMLNEEDFIELIPESGSEDSDSDGDQDIL